MKRRDWTNEEVKTLEECWGEITPHNIAKMLDRSLNSVRQKGYKMKLGPAKTIAGGRKWTDEEVSYLSENWGTISIEGIANNLERTTSAIEQKASRLNLGSFLEAGDYLTVNELITTLLGGRNKGRTYTIEQLIDKGLPYFNKKVNTHFFKVINIDDFWKWAEKNRTIIDFSRLERNILGIEPEWLEEQRRADKKMAKFKTTPWTESEDKRLLSLLREFKYNYRELSKKLNRTEGAIKRRISDLGYIERPVAMSKHNPWTDEEIDILVKLFNKGYRADVMTRYIERSAQSIRGKAERMILEGDLEPRSPHRKTC